MEARTARVMVKLEPGGSPDEVLFSPVERDQVAASAVQAEYVHVSTFIREICVDAALAVQDRVGRTDRELLQSSAQACDMKLGAWMRTVVLAGIKYEEEEVETPLPTHKREAAKWYRRKVRG